MAQPAHRPSGLRPSSGTKQSAKARISLQKSTHCLSRSNTLVFHTMCQILFCPVFKYLLSLPRKWRKIKPRTVEKSIGHRETGLTLNSKALGQSPHQTQRMGKKFSQTTVGPPKRNTSWAAPPPETKVVMPQLLC